MSKKNKRGNIEGIFTEEKRRRKNIKKEVEKGKERRGIGKRKD